MWDTVDQPQEPPLDPSAGQSCTPSWTAMLMCRTHHGQFNSYAFFIHFFPDVRLICLWFGPSIYSNQIRKFMFINYSSHPYLQQFHGKAITLDIKDKHMPFPSLFIIHEMRVRGFHPFQPVVPTVPDDMARLDLVKPRVRQCLRFFQTWPPTTQSQQQLLCASTAADDECRWHIIKSTYTSAEHRHHQESLISSPQCVPCCRGRPARLRAQAGLAWQKKTSWNMSLLLVHKIVDTPWFLSL